ncbi:MAG: hypothetical protein IPL95_14405 [Saprospiraceae bacterium]|nr:hypothetical protein [Saprospiraceae bacterium]
MSKGRIASDLFGITVSTFDSNRKGEEILDAISSSCLNILAKIKRILSEEGIDAKKSICDNPYFGICRHEANMYTEVADMLTNAREKVILFITNNERLVIFDLLISFVYTRFNKVSIDVHYFPQIQKDTNSYSIEIFKQIGCNAKEYPVGEAPNTIAFISDPKDPDYARMIVKTERFTRKNVFAYIYKGAIHHQAIKSVANDFEPLEKPKIEYVPKIVKISEQEIRDAFSYVPMYKLNNCKFSVVEVEAISTLPQSDNLVREYKIKQISLLDRMYEDLNIDLYEPTAIVLKNKKKHIIVPPVLEEKEGKLYVAEGHTRLYIHKDNKKKIKCVKVVGIIDPLPCEPTTWDKIVIAPDSVFRIISGDEASLQLTRKVEKYLHKADWFDDKKRL